MRYATWEELLAATLAWCRAEVERRCPAFDLATWERSTRDEVRAASAAAEARRVWNAVRIAMADAVDYLDAHPDAPGVHASMLRGLLNAPYFVMTDDAAQRRTDDGRPYSGVVEVRTTVRPLREGLVPWGRDSREERQLLGVGQSTRTALIGRYADREEGMWWTGRPTERDLAVLSLLAGHVPEIAKRRQERAGVERDRPAVLEVVAAEEKAIRKARARRPGSDEVLRLARAVHAKAKPPPR